LSTTHPPLEARKHLQGLIVCGSCDGLFKLAPLRADQHARCPDCHRRLQGDRRPSAQYALSAALSGAILLVIAASSPVLIASVGGLTTEVNLRSAPEAFASDWFLAAAWTLAFVSLAIPLAQVLILSWLLSFSLAHRRAPGFGWLLASLQLLRPWAMVEVFFLGTLIVIVKVGGWVSMVLGPGMFSLAAFSVLLATLHRFDSASLWIREDLK